MTTYVPLSISANATPPWQGNFTLDGANYQAQVVWNFAGQRYYLALYDNGGSLVWFGALVGSPLDYDIYLAPSLFTASTILYRADTNQFEVNP